MKIAFFQLNSLENIGGTEKYLFKISNQLKEKGKEITIISFNNNTNFLISKVIYLISLNINNFIRYKKKDFYKISESELKKKIPNIEYIKIKNVFDLKKVLSKQDVILSKNEILELFCLNIIGKKNLPPIIINTHTVINYPLISSLQDKIHNLVYNSFIYKRLLEIGSSAKVTNYLDKEFLEKYTKIKKVEKILHPIDFDNKFTQTSHIDYDNINLLFIGRMVSNKGLDILIQIVEKLNDRKINFQLKIIGSGDDNIMKEIEEFIKDKKNILFLKHQDNVETYYNWTDLVLIPSRYESLCQVAIEAGKYKKIALATNIPGPADIIENNETGFLLNLNAEEFVIKIEELYKLKQKNYEEFKKIGEKANKRVKKLFDKEENLLKLIELIKQTI